MQRRGSGFILFQKKTWRQASYQSATVAPRETLFKHGRHLISLTSAGSMSQQNILLKQLPLFQNKGFGQYAISFLLAQFHPHSLAFYDIKFTPLPSANYCLDEMNFVASNTGLMHKGTGHRGHGLFWGKHPRQDILYANLQHQLSGLCQGTCYNLILLLGWTDSLILYPYYNPSLFFAYHFSINMCTHLFLFMYLSIGHHLGQLSVLANRHHPRCNLVLPLGLTDPLTLFSFSSSVSICLPVICLPPSINLHTHMFHFMYLPIHPSRYLHHLISLLQLCLTLSLHPFSLTPLLAPLQGSLLVTSQRAQATRTAGNQQASNRSAAASEQY